jgi:hypothetical protein
MHANVSHTLHPYSNMHLWQLEPPPTDASIHPLLTVLNRDRALCAAMHALQQVINSTCYKHETNMDRSTACMQCTAHICRVLLRLVIPSPAAVADSIWLLPSHQIVTEPRFLRNCCCHERQEQAPTQHGGMCWWDMLECVWYGSDLVSRSPREEIRAKHEATEVKLACGSA